MKKPVRRRTPRLAPAAEDPFRNLARVRDQVLRLFDAAASRSDWEAGGDPASSWSPLVDLYETPTDVVLVAEVPGLARQDIEIQVTETQLTLRGGRPAEREESGAVHHRVERAHGAFSRTFQLPTAIDRDRVLADYRHGLLTITLPKAKQPRPRSVQVRSRP